MNVNWLQTYGEKHNAIQFQFSNIIKDFHFKFCAFITHVLTFNNNNNSNDRSYCNNFHILYGYNIIL